MDVIVVGGADSLIRGYYGSKMRANGVNIKWHEHQASRLDTIPQAAQGVVIIKDMVSHALAGAAIALAKNRGIPFVQVPRKFSHAVQILRASGFIASQPSILTVTPLTPATTPTTTATTATTTPTTTTDQDFETAVDMVFREDPYLAKRPADFAFRVQDLTGGSVFSTQIDQALQRRLDHLRGLRGLRGDPVAQEYRAQIRQRGMVAFMEEFLIEQGSLPKYKEIYEEAKHYFGASKDAGTVQRYLAIVTGNKPVDVTAQEPQQEQVDGPDPEDTEDGIVTLNVDRWASIQGMFSQLLEGQAEHLRVIKGLTEQSADLQSEVAYLRGRVTDLNMQVGCLRDSVSTSLSEAESEFGDRLTALEAASQPDTVGPALAQLVASGLSIRIEAK